MTMHGSINVVTVSTCGRCGRKEARDGAHGNVPPDNWTDLQTDTRRTTDEPNYHRWVLCWNCYIDVDRFLRKPPSVDEPSFTPDPTYSYQWNKVGKEEELQPSKTMQEEMQEYLKLHSDDPLTEAIRRGEASIEDIKREGD